MKITPFLLVPALLFSLPSFAAEQGVTVRQAIDLALGTNLLLQAARYEKVAAQEEVAASRSSYLPRLSLETGAALSTTPSTVFMMKLDEARIDTARDFSADTLNHPHARGDFRTSLALTQPLFDPNLRSGVEMAAKEAEATELRLAATREQVAFRVYQAYLEVRRARAFCDLAEQAVADAKEHARLAAVRGEGGVGLRSDRLRSATQLFEAQQRQVTVINDLLLARMRLNLVVGGKPGGLLDIAEEPKLTENALAETELVALALRQRPDLKGVEIRVEQADLALRRARNAFLPTVYASAGFQVNDRDLPLGWDNDSWSLGVNLRWELFDGSRRSHLKQKAELMRRAASAGYENERREVALQVSESLLRRQEMALRLVSARASVVDAREGMRLVGKRFENGLSALVELLDAEAALNRARANLVEVENGYLSATAQVYFSAGQFLKEVTK